MKISPLDTWISRKIGSANEALSRTGIEAWQLERLNHTLAWVRSQSPFYRDRFKNLPQSLSSLEELRRFPFTTPVDIAAAPNQFVCVSQDEIQRIVTLQTSGTTGSPKRLFFTAADQELTIDFFGVGMSTFTAPGDRVLILLPGERPGSVGDLLRRGLEPLGMTPIPHGQVRDPNQTLQIVDHQKIDCLVGSPTQVLGLAMRWKPEMYRPRSILLSTDYVPQTIVRRLQSVWGCAVYNHYGTTEMGLGGGVECEAHRGYHLREADLLFEVINPQNGEPVADGTCGELVFTTLTRSGMPLLRYRMGDRSRFLNGKCPCGSQLKTLEKVSGRFDGFVRAGDTILELPHFDEALFALPDLLNFSVMLTGSQEEPYLEIDTHFLRNGEFADDVREALDQIPSVKNLQIEIRSHFSPDEAGSLRKRVIADKRC